MEIGRATKILKISFEPVSGKTNLSESLEADLGPLFLTMSPVLERFLNHYFFHKESSLTWLFL